MKKLIKKVMVAAETAMVNEGDKVSILGKKNTQKDYFLCKKGNKMVLSHGGQDLIGLDGSINSLIFINFIIKVIKK